MSANHTVIPTRSLENNLIQLSLLQEKDFDALYEVASDPLIWELHPVKDRYKRDVFKKFFDSAIESRSAFLVFDKETNSLIGSSRYYNYEPEQSCVSIGYTFLARKYWGGIYNRSMKELMMNYAFDFVDRVIFEIGAANYRSQKAIEKIGAKKLALIDFDNLGEIQPHFQYEIAKADWEKTGANEKDLQKQ